MRTSRRPGSTPISSAESCRSTECPPSLSCVRAPEVPRERLYERPRSVPNADPSHRVEQRRGRSREDRHTVEGVLTVHGGVFRCPRAFERLTESPDPVTPPTAEGGAGCRYRSPRRGARAASRGRSPRTRRGRSPRVRPGSRELPSARARPCGRAPGHSRARARARRWRRDVRGSSHGGRARAARGRYSRSPADPPLSARALSFACSRALGLTDCLNGTVATVA